MQSAQDFLLAAKRCEMNVLDQLGLTCELVGDLGELIHSLQRERGASNVYLGSGGCRFEQQLRDQVTVAQQAEVAVRNRFSQLAESQRVDVSSVRLFSRIAHALHTFDDLLDLRQRILATKVTAAGATHCFTRVIAALLNVVFEAADTATDPELTRLLVSLFNLLQGKEFAGQERALGATGFAAGFFSPESQQKILHLLDAQNRCFDIFYQFSTPAAQTDWQVILASPVHAELLRLRGIAQATSAQVPVPSSLSEVWYELTSCRIDELHDIERQLTLNLKQLAQHKRQLAQVDLLEHKSCLKALAVLDQQALDQQALDSQVSTLTCVSVLENSLADCDLHSAALVGISPRFSRSVFELINAQAQRLQLMHDQLGVAKKTLQERKLIERAKGLLMSHRGITEDQAYRLLRQAAMAQQRRLIEVAETLIASLELLGDAGTVKEKRVPL